MMSDGTCLAEAMLGLDGFRILEMAETPDEMILTVETTAVIEGCRRCGDGAPLIGPLVMGVVRGCWGSGGQRTRRG